MKPDEKYMMNSFRQSNDEIKFKPFDPNNFIPNFQKNIIPVMLWGNLVINPSNILPPNYTLPNSSNSTSTNNSKAENPFGNPMYPNEIYNSQNISMGYENNETNYPDETESSYLYSYNKGNKSTSNSMNIKDNNSNNNLNNILRNLDSNIDEDKDLARACYDEKVNEIYKNVLNDSNLMCIFKGYEIPKPIIKLIIMRVIKTSLKYCKKGR